MNVAPCRDDEVVAAGGGDVACSCDDVLLLSDWLKRRKSDGIVDCWTSNNFVDDHWSLIKNQTALLPRRIVRAFDMDLFVVQMP